MPKVIDAQIATGGTINQFNASLRECLGADYQPFGSIAIGRDEDGYHYAQTMVKYAPESEPTTPDTKPDGVEWDEEDTPPAAGAPGGKLVKKALKPGGQQ